jgi:hypothetical protein
MQKMIECQNCGAKVPANPRLKGNQRYCHKVACQTARKSQWYRRKLVSDAEYAERQKECKQNWRKNKPSHQYQTHYRQTHPEYVETNRQQQRSRNKKRRISTNEKTSEKIVKIDALLVQLQPYQATRPLSGRLRQRL